MQEPENESAARCPVDHTALSAATDTATVAAEPARQTQSESAACPVDHSTPGNGAASAAKPAEAKPQAVSATTLPGPKEAALRQILTYWRDPAGFVENCRQQYGSRFALRIRVPPRPLYVLTDPEDIKQMFQAPADVLHTGNGSATIEKFTGQTGLAWLDENEHAVRRRLLMPTMHGKALQRITEAVDTMAVSEVAQWPRGEIMALHPHVHRFTLHVIREVIFGKVVPTRWPELLDTLTEMMAFNNRIASAMLIHKMSPNGVRLLKAIRPLGLARFLKLRAHADALIAEAVQERRRIGQLGDDMLSVLLGVTHEDGSPLSQVELRDEMMTIFLAGTETTAAAITWSFEYLSREPEVCARLTAEIDAGEDDAYLTASVNEALRLRPSIPQIIPREVMKPIEIGGVRYEPGMLLWASAYLLQRNPDIFPEPERFRPERYLDGKPDTLTWIPFGGGRIRCLGASIALVEMKAVLREVLRQYRLVRTDLTPEVTRSRCVSTLPSRGARLELRSRERQTAAA